jgi:hypothetical protein
MPVDGQRLIVDHRYTDTGEVRPVRERDER